MTLTPDTDYIFSIWVSTWNAWDSAPANLTFSIGDISLGSFTAPLLSAGIWKEHSYSFNSGVTNGSVQLGIFDTTTALAGNDFAIDDISLTQSSVPVPAAIWIFGSGLLGLIGIGRKFGS